MKRRHIFFFVLLLAVAAFAVWYLDDPASRIDDAAGKVTASVEAGETPQVGEDDLSTLAMKSIDLRQGEGGTLLWRLRAEWGAMRQEDELMVLEKPHFIYRMEEDRELQITSDTGEIDQDAQTVRFIGTAVATVDDSILRTRLMVYDGKTRTLTLPDPVEFEGPEMSLRAARAIWYLDEQHIVAEERVVAHWERDDSFLDADGEEYDGDERSGNSSEDREDTAAPQ